MSEDEQPEPPVQVGLFPSLCREEVIDGEECIVVPKKNYHIVLLVPYTGTFRSANNGTRIPVHGIYDNDWSLHVDMFINGKLQPPMSKINVSLDRDAPDHVPDIELRWHG